MIIIVKLTIRMKVSLLLCQIWHCILKFEVEKTQAKQVPIDSLTLKFDQLNNSLYFIVGPYLGGWMTKKVRYKYEVK